MRSSDFKIFKVVVYPSKYWIDKYHKGDIKAIVKFNDITKEWIDFRWKLIEFVTKKRPEDFYKLYHSAQECAVEEMMVDHGIFLSDSEANSYILIPNSRTELIEWFYQNIGNLEFKIVKRLNLDFRFINKSSWKREAYQLSDEFKEALKDI